MLRSDDMEGNLARDYLHGAEGFMCAAEKILQSTDMNSGEWLFKLENPVCFLISHAAELILKAGLVKQPDFEKLKFIHDLWLLAERSREKHVPLNDVFCSCIKVINENFLNHDLRYQRSFSGFPDCDHDRLEKMMKENPAAVKKDLREFGLVIRTIPDLKSFLQATTAQLHDTSEWIEQQ